MKTLDLVKRVVLGLTGQITGIGGSGEFFVSTKRIRTLRGTAYETMAFSIIGPVKSRLDEAVVKDRYKLSDVRIVRSGGKKVAVLYGPEIKSTRDLSLKEAVKSHNSMCDSLHPDYEYFSPSAFVLR